MSNIDIIQNVILFSKKWVFMYFQERINELSQEQFVSHMKSGPILNQIFFRKTSMAEPAAYTSKSTSIKFTMEGENCFLFDNWENKISKGGLLIVNEGTPVINYSKKRTTAISIFLDNALLNEVYHDLSKNGTIIGYEESQTTIYQPFYDREIMENIELKSHIHLLYKQASIDIKNGNVSPEMYYRAAELLLRDYYKINQQVQRLPQHNPANRKEVFRRLNRGKAYINDNFLSNIDLDEICKFANLSKYHFIRLFKEVYQSTPHQYIINKKIFNACKLLRESKNSIKEIADQLSYPDIPTFTKQFKKSMGITPIEYRIGKPNT